MKISFDEKNDNDFAVGYSCARRVPRARSRLSRVSFASIFSRVRGETVVAPYNMSRTQTFDDALIGDIYINITRPTQLIVATYLTTTGTIATIGNVLVILTLLRYGTFRKKAINFILLNMAASDLGVSFSGYLMISASSYAGRWLFGDSGCRYLAFCVYTFSCSTIGSHVALAVYRYIYVCKPAIKHKLDTKLTAKVIAVIWVYGLFWTVTPFIGWSSYTYEPFGLSCSLDWTSRSPSNIVYNVACVVGVFALPLVVMIYCYYKVTKRSNRIDPTRMENKDMGVAIFLQMQKKDEKVDYHVTKMCILLTVSFILAWTPYTVASLWGVFTKIDLNAFSALIPTMCAKSSCMMNPIIYIIASSSYRRDLIRLFRRKSGSGTGQGTDGASGAAAGQSSSAVYLRRTMSPSGDPLASVYFNKERVYIGDIKPSGFHMEAKITKKDPDVLSTSSSSTSEYKVVVKQTETKVEPTVQVEI